MARLRPYAAVCAIAAVLWAAIGHGFANYDALYALIWGRELAHGQAPQVDVQLAPTTHPLANLLGVVLSALPARTAEDVLVVIAYLALAAAGWLVFRLGRLWFGWAAGLLAAVVLLTREPVISYGVRAYVDVPYLVLVLGALLVEARRARAGAPVLALLALAGLVRPEAWLFSLAYLAYLRTGRRVRPSEVALAASAIVLWLGYDLVTSGDALRSLHDTRQGTRELGRDTGIAKVPVTLPRRVGEVLREPGLVGAVAGLALGWGLLRERMRLLVASGVLAVVAFAVLGAAGLPILTRYAFVVAALGAVLCGGGAFGWMAVTDGRWVWRWRLVGLVVIGLLIGFAPWQEHRLRSTARAISTQQRIRDDLYALLDERRLPSGRVGVANHRLVPLVALVTNRGPQSIVTPPAAGLRSFVGPATSKVARQFILDPHDPTKQVAGAPAGMREVARNASWVLYERG
ncbi:MAG TPA: hypothetical protein VHB30_06040 [Solirubrobacteraceae bacterium]|jgi:hypothetical protein|nr:hypothetical protein [Solirubrobacteraceae bacterium]